MLNEPIRRRMITIGIVLSLAALFLFVSGFVLALGTILGTGSALQQADQNMFDQVNAGKTLTPEQHPTSHTEQPWPKLIVALGDSLARGIGDDGAGGFVGRLRALLETKGKYVPALTNLAVSGATSQDLLDKLLEPGVSETVGKADLLVVSIGGNDAFPDAGVLGQLQNDRGQLLEVQRAQSAQLDAYRERLNQAIQTLRSDNDTAPIILIGLYDPFYDLQEIRRASARAVHAWNGVIEEVAATYDDVYVVPTYDIMLLGGKTYLSSDHFHPNAEGYAAIADRLFATVQAYAKLRRP